MATERRPRERIVPPIAAPRRRSPFVALICLLAACIGCVGEDTYLPRVPSSSFLGQRFDDLLDMGDIGFTFSFEPSFALYYDLTPLIPIGYSKVDGWFAGVGGGHVGIMRHYQRNLGLILYGEEEVGFARYDKDDDASLNRQKVGLLGIAQGLPERRFPGPDYTPSCLHYIHTGWFGAVANLRYLQMVDFLLGWFGVDLCFDDGREHGAWFAKDVYVPPKWASPGAGAPAKKPVREAWRPDILKELSEMPRKVKEAQAAAGGTAGTAPLRVYVVRQGDVGLLHIAQEQLGGVEHWYRIAELNNLKPPYEIRPGQKLLLPAK